MKGVFKEYLSGMMKEKSTFNTKKDVIQINSNKSSKKFHSENEIFLGEEKKKSLKNKAEPKIKLVNFFEKDKKFI